MAELANCLRCGVVFANEGRNICHKCFQEEEKAFGIVYKYIRKKVNRGATIAQIHEATGVSEEMIMKFVREKRLQTSKFPKLAYPCEKCGDDIVEGKLCLTCSKELIDELRKQNQHLQQSPVKEQNTDTYYNFEKNRNETND